jgi:hypothetical protein
VDVFELAQNIGGAFEVAGVPENDRRDDEMRPEARCC